MKGKLIEQLFYKRSFIVMFFLLLLFLMILLPLQGRKQDIVIDFFSPRSANDMFWSKFTGFMTEAVDDLGMKINVHHADGNHLKMVEQVKPVH